MFQDTSREYLRYFTDLKPREHPRYYMVSAQVVYRNFPRFKSESEIDEKKTSSRTVSAFFYRLLICIQYRGVPVGLKTIKASLAATYQELEDLLCATGPPPDCNYISGRTMLRCGGSTDIQCAAWGNSLTPSPLIHQPRRLKLIVTVAQHAVWTAMLLGRWPTVPTVQYIYSTICCQNSVSTIPNYNELNMYLFLHNMYMLHHQTALTLHQCHGHVMSWLQRRCKFYCTGLKNLHTLTIRANRTMHVIAY